jgi:heme/copper-type cytochrome/quinol oxidase subunit 4
MRGDPRPEIDLEAIERAARLHMPDRVPRHHVLASRILRVVILVEILFVLLAYGSCFLGFDPFWLTNQAGIPSRLGVLLVFGAPGLFIAVLAVMGLILADSESRRRWFMGAGILGLVWMLLAVFAAVVGR